MRALTRAGPKDRRIWYLVFVRLYLFVMSYFLCVICYVLFVARGRAPLLWASGPQYRCEINKRPPQDTFGGLPPPQGPLLCWGALPLKDPPTVSLWPPLVSFYPMNRGAKRISGGRRPTVGGPRGGRAPLVLTCEISSVNSATPGHGHLLRGPRGARPP